MIKFSELQDFFRRFAQRDRWSPARGKGQNLRWPAQILVHFLRWKLLEFAQRVFIMEIACKYNQIKGNVIDVIYSHTTPFER